VHCVFPAPLLFPEGYNYSNSRFLTPIGHEDCVACLICSLIPTILCGFVILKSPWRWLGMPVLFLMTYLAVYTDVDTAKLGFLAAAVLLPCLAESRERLQELLVGLIPILLGAALGLVLGKGLHTVIINALVVEYMSFERRISPLSYLLAFTITILFTLLTNAFMRRRLDAVDMAESLKSVE
jgi:hypothetical protein